VLPKLHLYPPRQLPPAGARRSGMDACLVVAGGEEKKGADRERGRSKGGPRASPTICAEGGGREGGRRSPARARRSPQSRGSGPCRPALSSPRWPHRPEMRRPLRELGRCGRRSARQLHVRRQAARSIRPPPPPALLTEKGEGVQGHPHLLATCRPSLGRPPPAPPRSPPSRVATGIHRNPLGRGRHTSDLALPRGEGGCRWSDPVAEGGGGGGGGGDRGGTHLRVCEWRRRAGERRQRGVRLGCVKERERGKPPRLRVRDGRTAFCSNVCGNRCSCYGGSGRRKMRLRHELHKLL
jgi:hypothetical protein